MQEAPRFQAIMVDAVEAVECDGKRRFAERPEQSFCFFILPLPAILSGTAMSTS